MRIQQLRLQCKDTIVKLVVTAYSRVKYGTAQNRNGGEGLVSLYMFYKNKYSCIVLRCSGWNTQCNHAASLACLADAPACSSTRGHRWFGSAASFLDDRAGDEEEHW